MTPSICCQKFTLATICCFAGRPFFWSSNKHEPLSPAVTPRYGAGVRTVLPAHALCEAGARETAPRSPPGHYYSPDEHSVTLASANRSLRDSLDVLGRSRYQGKPSMRLARFGSSLYFAVGITCRHRSANSPHSDPIPVCGCKLLSVWAESDARERVGAPQRAIQPAGRDVPQLHRVITGRTGKRLSVRTEAHTVHSVSVARQRVEFATRRNLPHLCRVIPGRTRNEPAVRTETCRHATAPACPRSVWSSLPVTTSHSLIV